MSLSLAVATVSLQNISWTNSTRRGKLAFEINESMFDQLAHIKDKRLIAIYDSAENLGLYMDRENISHLDSVISSIPFVVLPTELSISILSEAKRYLKKGGIFIQYNYSRILKDLYKTIFQNYTSEYVLLNTPPAFIFKCTKK
ncbi:MAG: hypothetical protein IPN29_00400 [Saprospiraceae bacterium]|nr:hypothetical protein [Saprospiraceae bacterium]